ncbi:M23 family metallopeptidase [Ramlibacter sp. XY19]|uniref:M23 family metallopeptidase n=1 Tax=Ramlibacter paludis TaxID=2908000 RepID=UPI0023DB5883|nr:M23 family metallopeptidase [Ramlibacter paludis]MCG2591515.1 M23 family metallopeptidase [Ramlibacter paludis]
MDRRWLLPGALAVLLHASSGVRPPVPLVLPVAPVAKRSTPAADPLSARTLGVPVQGIRAAQLHDNFSDTRSRGRKHKALDIMAPRGTPVLAADDGKVAKISSNKGGGLSVYQVDPSGAIVYYYAHLDRYADNLRDGQPLRRGDVIGYVGTTGNAPETAPHLHFAVLVLEQKGRWWGGEALNPYDALVRGEAVTTAGR